MKKLFKFLTLPILVLCAAVAARHGIQQFSSALGPSGLRDAPGPVRPDGEDFAVDQLRSLAPVGAAVPVTSDVQATAVESMAKAEASSVSQWFPDYSRDSAPPLCSVRPDEDMVPLAAKKLKIVAHYGDNYGQVPASKSEEVERLTGEIESAPSYEDAIEILTRYLNAIGAIQRVRALHLLHSSDVGPDVIMREGLLSLDEVIARKGPGASSTLVSDAIGRDGIYFIEDKNVPSTFSDWGAHHYKGAAGERRSFSL